MQNFFVGHVLSDEWNPYHYVKEADSVIQSKKECVEKDGAISKKATLIKSAVDKAS